MERKTLCGLLLVVCWACASADLIRSTNYGQVRGLETALSQKFLGIPFASPPDRWEAPVDPLPWDGVLDTVAVKPMCPQLPCDDSGPVSTCVDKTSEDCLYLNIFAPLGTTPTSKLAVILYIHGGGFESGSGGANVYNGEVFAAKGNIIVVTINYRLGALGFLVTGKGANDIKGNFGIKDQRQAIKWVYENIINFGGDPDKITLMGQSAGATSIAVHLTAGKVDNMIKSVIMQSTPFGVPLTPCNEAIRLGTAFTRSAKCPTRDTDCLKKRCAASIVAAQEKAISQFSFEDSSLRRFFEWVPTVDDDEVPKGLLEAFRSGTFATKPVIFGTVKEEGIIYIYRVLLRRIYFLQYLSLSKTIEPHLSRLSFLRLYPYLRYRGRPGLSKFLNDYVFACPTRLAAKMVSESNSPVYAYVFDNSFSVRGVWGDDTACEDRPCHGVNVPYDFGSARIPPYIFSAQELTLSESLICHWSNFATSGNPNLPVTCTSPDWPELTANPKCDKYMYFNEDGNHIERKYLKKTCDRLDSLDYKAR